MKEINSKEKILNTATKLFAIKGFAGTGVREIVREANVNISMVNYYFKSKSGILQEIITRVFDLVVIEIFNKIKESDNFEERIRKLVFILAELMKNKPDLFKVALIEFPLDYPEISKLKAEKLKSIIPSIYRKIFGGFDDSFISENIRLDIVGPALTSIIFSHHLFKPMIESMEEHKYDEQFYHYYADYIADIFLHGFLSKIKGKS